MHNDSANWLLKVATKSYFHGTAYFLGMLFAFYDLEKSERQASLTKSIQKQRVISSIIATVCLFLFVLTYVAYFYGFQKND